MKIAFFAFETRNLNTFPSILNAARLLSCEGHFVDVYLPSPMATDVSIDRCRFLIISDLNQHEYLLNAVHSVRHSGSVYDAFFAFYIEGLFVSEIINRKLSNKVPVIYFSMELMYKDYQHRLIKACMSPVSIIRACYGLVSQVYRKLIPCQNAIQQKKNNHLDALCYSVIALKSWMRLKKTGKELIKLSVISDQLRARVLKDEFSFVEIGRAHV